MVQFCVFFILSIILSDFGSSSSSSGSGLFWFCLLGEGGTRVSEVRGFIIGSPFTSHLL